MSRTNSRQPRERPPPTRTDSDHHSVEGAGIDSAPRSPGSGAASPTPAPARDPTVRPSFSFANAAAASGKKEEAPSEAPTESQPTDVEAVAEKLAETTV